MKQTESTRRMLEAIGLGVIRRSRNGVPHLVYDGFSVAYFQTERKYRVFWPLPSFGMEQISTDFRHPEDVRNFITRRPS